MKSLLKVTGAKALNNDEKRKIKGAGPGPCAYSSDPSTDWCCHLQNGCP